MNKKNVRGMPFVFHVSMVLLLLLLLSVHMTGGLLARFTSSYEGSGSARVARFSFTDHMTAQAQIVPASLAPGESKTTRIEIQNDGEVTLQCTVKIDNLTGNLPIADQLLPPIVLASGESGALDVTIDWPSEENSAEKYMGKMDAIRITVTVEQLD